MAQYKKSIAKKSPEFAQISVKHAGTVMDNVEPQNFTLAKIKPSPENIININNTFTFQFHDAANETDNEPVFERVVTKESCCNFPKCVLF